MHGFERVNYFVYENVKVYEEGKRLESEKVDKLTTEQIMHGGK